MIRKSFLFLFFILLTLQAFAYELSSYDRVLKQTVLYKAGKTYINNVRSEDGDVLRWNKGEFPIRVYCEMSKSVPYYYFSSCTDAVKIWEKESDGVLKFKIISDKDSANIEFKVLNKQSPDATLAYTETFTNPRKKELVKNVISIYEKGENGKYYSPNEALSISVHEFGHALGIAGHSENPQSMMYAEYSMKNRKISDFLNLEDKNTLKLLYDIIPDYTNGDKLKDTGSIKAKILFL